MIFRSIRSSIRVRRRRNDWKGRGHRGIHPEPPGRKPPEHGITKFRLGLAPIDQLPRIRLEVEEFHISIFKPLDELPSSLADRTARRGPERSPRFVTLGIAALEVGGEVPEQRATIQGIPRSAGTSDTASIGRSTGIAAPASSTSVGWTSKSCTGVSTSRAESPGARMNSGVRTPPS